MKQWIIIMMLCTGGMLLACNDDDERLSPSDIAEYELTLPQGDHDYDDRIVDWFERTGVYILYKFDPVDVYYRPTSSWPEVTWDTTRAELIQQQSSLIYTDGSFVLGSAVSEPIPLGEIRFYEENQGWYYYELRGEELWCVEYRISQSGSFLVGEAEEEHVGAQLTFVEENFLNFYPDEVLREFMPLKLCLGKELQNADAEYLHVYSNFNNLIVSHGDASLGSLTVEEKEAFKFELNSFLVNRVIDSLSLDAFYAVSDYSWTTSLERPSTSECYASGFIVRPTSTSGAYCYDAEDFADVILENSYETLTAEPASGAYDANDFTGILHRKKDVNGLIREKYDLLIAAFAERGIDLQKIGDAPVQE